MAGVHLAEKSHCSLDCCSNLNLTGILSTVDGGKGKEQYAGCEFEDL